MSGTQVSSFAPANILYDAASGKTFLDNQSQQIANQYAPQRNQLLLDKGQQELGMNDVEYASRVAQGLIAKYGNDEAAMAAVYPGVIQQAQGFGMLKNAPPAFPGLARVQQLASLGISSEKQYQIGANVAANQAQLGSGATPGVGTRAPTQFTPTQTGPVEPEALGRAQAVRDGLVKRGLDPETATAFAANALHESRANPNTGPGDAGASHGLFQWRGDRAQAYQQRYGHSPDNAPLDEQLDYVMSELNGSESLAKDRINNAQGVAGKAAQVSEAYLRPKDTAAEMSRRSGTALQLANQWGVTAPPKDPATMSDQEWLAWQSKQYPSLGGPNQNPTAPRPGGTYQEASLTPTPPPASTTPAQPSSGGGTTAQTQTAQTQQQPRPQPLDLDAEHLTPQNRRDLTALTRTLSPEDFAARKIAMQNQNIAEVNRQATEARQQAQDARQAQQDAQARADKLFEQQRQIEQDKRSQAEAQRQQEAAARDTERLKIAQAEAAVKAKQAAQPYQGQGTWEQQTNTLMTAEPGSREYAIAYQALATPHTDPQTGAQVYPILSAFEKPTYKPPGATEVPDYTNPKIQLPQVMNQDQATAASYADRMRTADAIMQPLDTTAVTWGQQVARKAGDYIGYNINSPDNQRLKQAQENFISAILRKESGAAISQSEFDRYAGFYFPRPGDDAATIQQKQQTRAQAIAGLSREAGPAYKPKDVTPVRPPISSFDKR